MYLNIAVEWLNLNIVPYSGPFGKSSEARKRMHVGNTVFFQHFPSFEKSQQTHWKLKSTSNIHLQVHTQTYTETLYLYLYLYLFIYYQIIQGLQGLTMTMNKLIMNN